MRCAVAAALASSAVVAMPVAAVAAQNRAPDQPVRAELETGGEQCATGEDRPYVRTRPQLSAVLRDQDAVPPVYVRLTGEFEVSWQDAAGERQVRTGQTGFGTSGRPVTWTVPGDVPPATEVSWRVRAFDGEAWGPWSSDGGKGACEFVYDDESPAKPSVSSPEYPDDTQWRDGVGVRGTFRAASSSKDTVAYVYIFTGESPKTVEAERPGGPAELSWLPERAGPVTVSVQARDRAGNRSEPTTHRFRVSEGSGPAAHWKLADRAGSAEGADAAGGTAAKAGDGVTFGAEGPSRTEVRSAAELDGSAGAYLTSGAPAVDTGRAFAVSAWVRPDEVGRGMAAVSQDGEGVAAYRLGTDGDGDWSFALGGRDGTVVRAKGGTPERGEWAHLTGVYDPAVKTARLYVNGRLVDTAENAPAPWGSGAAQIGRALEGSGQGRNWDGRVADVRAWHRVVVADEVAGLAARTAERQGQWRLDEASGSASPERDGGQPLALGGDARIRHDDQACDPLDPECGPGNPPMVGAGELVLDGAGDFAATGAPVVDTGESFSLAAHVRLDPSAEDRTMTVLSLPGEHAGLATLRYTPQRQIWELALAHEDRAGAETTTLKAEGDWATSGSPHHLAVVYDDGADEVLLYVDGTVAARAPFHHAWRSTGGLQVGRAPVADAADGWGEHLYGAVDEVHAFAGALSEHEVAVLRAGV
ncbi:LamG domain-containing protein [Streptomyces formicae]|uniref:LamG domain-containing protein n=1 Tax=Streptomyces formicae TaxID=1616117 RepID=UPI000BF319A6|nr:LamG domain-containing protein [Streptomyces formicae]